MLSNASIKGLLVASAFFMSMACHAAEPPKREVRINDEHFSALTLVEQQRVLEIKYRLESIIAIDRTSMEPAQRAQLRNEWRMLKGEMKEYDRNGSVIYISTAGIVIIILVLIILL